MGSGVAFVALFTLGSCGSGVTLVAFFALGSCGSGVTFVALVALFTLGSCGSGVAFIALVALFTWIPLVSFIAFEVRIDVAAGIDREDYGVRTADFRLQASSGLEYRRGDGAVHIQRTDADAAAADSK